MDKNPHRIGTISAYTQAGRHHCFFPTPAKKTSREDKKYAHTHTNILPMAQKLAMNQKKSEEYTILAGCCAVLLRLA